MDASAERSAPCDLLYPDPWIRLDVVSLQQSMVFGFASGDIGEVFSEALDRGQSGESEWEPLDFAEDIFLSSFVKRCLGVTIDGHAFAVSHAYVTRQLAQPPVTLDTVKFRQGIAAELAGRDDLRRSLEQLYRALVKFRDLLGRRPLGRLDSARRRVEILRAVAALTRIASTEFRTATSGLSRIAEWGDAIAARDSYRRLCELIDYEANVAEIDVRVVVGFDGTIRGFQPLARKDNVSNLFYQSFLGRLFTRLLLFIRGYRFSNAELLSRLVDDVFSGLEDQLVHAFQLIGDIEIYLGVLGFRDHARRAGHETCLPTFHDEGRRQLTDLFNPFLLYDGPSCVPCTLDTQKDAAMTILTGPNSGGKTRLMQSITLTQVLAQAGLFVPAASARLPWAHGLFVSVIERPDACQTEGRLGTELLRIRRLFEHLQYGSLVILDELCSGTNPTEGEEMFELVIELLAELKPQAFIITHFLQFAERLRQESRPLEFLQVELDAAQCPTFSFVPGVATTSLASKVAERLGVTREELRALIRRNNPELRNTARKRLVSVSAA
jgi:DNA mismatch repair protein MutS2